MQPQMAVLRVPCCPCVPTSWAACCVGVRGCNARAVLPITRSRAHSVVSRLGEQAPWQSISQVFNREVRSGAVRTGKQCRERVSERLGYSPSQLVVTPAQLSAAACMRLLDWECTCSRALSLRSACTAAQRSPCTLTCLHSRACTHTHMCAHKRTCFTYKCMHTHVQTHVHAHA